MKKTSVVVSLFLAAILVGLAVRMFSTTTPIATEHFMQREKGMPLEMEVLADGPVGVAGFSGTPPLLASEPKPVPVRPYEQANDTELFLFQNNKISAECCPSPFTSDKGCVCLTDAQTAMFASRGGNRSMT